MALYHKYRPNEFGEILGNEETIESIVNLLNKKDHPRVYMLAGPTGCGKTTIARIMANELDCTGQDFEELNSASFRGIDTARDIIKRSKYKPIQGANRMFLIDECHKLTNDAQNALLKTLEDTPENVYFVLATTEPNKLIKAIHNRCSLFTVTPLTDKQMYKLLRRIVRAEDDELDKEVYDQIILDAQGHVRQALQVLEQVLSAEPDSRLVIAERKAEEHNEGIELCRALAAGKRWDEVKKILAGLKHIEPETIRRAVAGYAAAILMKTDNPQAGLILELFTEPFYNTGWPDLVYACYSVIKQ